MISFYDIINKQTILKINIENDKLLPLFKF